MTNPSPFGRDASPTVDSDQWSLARSKPAERYGGPDRNEKLKGRKPAIRERDHQAEQVPGTKRGRWRHYGKHNELDLDDFVNDPPPPD